MKKTVRLLLCTLMLLLVFALPVSAETYGDLTLTFSGSSATVVNCDESLSGTLKIPAKVNGYTVTRIGLRAFANCKNLTEITIPDSVTSIADEAFSSCSSLRSISIPDSVGTIEQYAFSGCSSLKSVVLPKGITRIATGTFSRCKGLKNIKIPYGVTSIAGSAFAKCSGLTNVTIPSSVTVIENLAFAECTGLTGIKIPYGVKSIDRAAFGCCESLKSITIPDSVTNIGEQAFSMCSELKRVTIPKSVTSMGKSVFYACENVTIYGYSGSTAEKYAAENKIPFVLLSDNLFDDVKASDWFAPYVNDLASLGILNGKGYRADGTPYFDPQGLITRGEFSKILATAAGEDLKPYSGYSMFDDTAGHWAASYINWAFENEIVTGFPDRTFRPDASITREEMAVMICRYAEYQGIALPKVNEKATFVDADQIVWSGKYVYAMQQAGIISGYDEYDGCYFKPQGNATRAEAATMFSRFLDL